MPKQGRKVKSMRGTVVDFDLLDIQNQLATSPKPTEVQAREDFVDRKLRRRQRVAERAAAAAENKKQADVNVDAKEQKTPEVKEEVRHLAKDMPKVEEPAPVEKKVSKKKTTTKKAVTKKTSTTKRTIKKKAPENEDTPE